MKTFFRLLLQSAALVGFALLITGPPVRLNAQQVTPTINFPFADVYYFTDYLDVKEKKLLETISGGSLDLQRTDSTTDLQVCVYISVDVTLQGKDRRSLVTAYTSNFLIRGGYRQIGPSEITSKLPGREIYIRDPGYTESGIDPKLGDGNLMRKDLEDLASKSATGTLPLGTYLIHLEVLPATPNDPYNHSLPSRSKVYGGTDRKIDAVLSTPAEVVVEQLEPENGSIMNTLAPTIRWQSQYSPIKVQIYQVLPTDQSVYDALGRQAYYEENVSGSTSFTYPNSAKPLQLDYAYVVKLSAVITTSRGPQLRSSQPFVFVVTNDNVGKLLDRFASAIGGDVQSVITGLRNPPTSWTQRGSILFDNRTLQETDVIALLNALQQRGVQLNVSTRSN